ncbi:MAG: ATP-binding protein [Chloroflexota bacterium]|nr:ATP-binding protein [Chloroflexota bacterium]
MSPQPWFEPARLLQTLLLALSIFNTVAFLWLATTVWLNGDRRARITRWGVVGLGLAALFFCLHALLIWLPLSNPSTTLLLEILWHLIWLPALGTPYIWFVIGLHYASLINASWRRRRPLLLAISAGLAASVLLLLILNQATFTFAGTLRLLAYGDLLTHPGLASFSPAVLLPTLFLAYVTFCAIGPWFTPKRTTRLLGVLWQGLVRTVRRRRAKAPTLLQSLVDAFWDDPTDVELLEEPVLSWHLARPRLLLAALLMVALTTVLGVLAMWSMVNWLEREQQAPLPPHHVLTAIPLELLILDIITTGVVALIILVIGYSIVRHGILIERPLARRGFFEQWRGIVIVSTAVAIFIALLVTFTNSSLSGLLLITALATGVYALFTWSNYTAHDRYIALLGPFLRSTTLGHWLNIDASKTEHELENIFFHLCHNVLAVRSARLVVMAGSVRRTFSYRWPENAWLGETQGQHLGGDTRKPRPVSRQGEADKQASYPEDETGQHRQSAVTTHRVRMISDGQTMICWVMPIYDERGLVATLYLGPREDGGAFTDEDMNLAQACGQRILDTLGDHEAMQAVAGLLRRRIVDVKLLGAQQRRVLHDEILPQMHLALLRLETLRSLNGSATLRSPEPTDSQQALNEAIGMISDAHRRLAAMMRTTAPGAPYRLEREGMMQAIHTMLEQDFQNAFDEVAWCVSDETAACIDEVTPPAIAELIFAAVQEALRNAARHARGSDVHRYLRLTLTATCQPDLEVSVSDDGVGIASASRSTTGTGGGLLSHSALLAIAGGNLTIKSAPGEGVTVRILLPGEALC